MGTSEYDIKCTACDYREVYASPDAHYVLGEDVTFSVQDRPAWCVAENRLVSAEALPTLDELAARLVEDRPVMDAGGLDYVTGLSFHTQMLDQRDHTILEWRRRRSGPERCLSCGSTDLITADVETQPEHPGCPGNGRLQITRWVVALRRDVGPGFTGDGLRISAEA